MLHSQGERNVKTVEYTSRRRFVVGGLVSVAGLGVAGCGGGASTGTPGSGTVVAPPGGAVAAAPLIQSEVSEWEKLLGSSFVITTGSGKRVATLASLERIGADINRPTTLARHQAFFAYFEMNSDRPPEGGRTYQVSHSTRGTFDLLLGQSSKVGGKDVMVAVLA